MNAIFAGTEALDVTMHAGVVKREEAERGRAETILRADPSRTTIIHPLSLHQLLPSPSLRSAYKEYTLVPIYSIAHLELIALNIFLITS